MWEGWTFERAWQRHLRYARELMDAGVSWRQSGPEDWPVVADLIREHVLGAEEFHPQPDDPGGAVLTLDRDDSLIGALVMGAADFQGRLAVMVRYLAVSPDWRRRGVGAVSLGLLRQLLGTDADMIRLTFGSCAAGRAARFYQHAGFTVLDPGTPLPFPLGSQALLGSMSSRYPCWFYRTW